MIGCMPITTSHGGATPFALTWPRTTERTVLRLVTLDDVDGMLAYRRLPEVCRHLTHEPLDRAGVEERIRWRLAENQPAEGPLLCGVAVDVDGRMVGDAMMRLDPIANEMCIGYAFHPDVWGQGLGTEVAAALLDIGRELGAAVWADAYTDNTASQRVLERAGLVPHHTRDAGGRRLVVFTSPDDLHGSRPTG